MSPPPKTVPMTDTFDASPIAAATLRRAIESSASEFAEYRPEITWQSETLGRITFQLGQMSLVADVVIVPEKTVTVTLHVPAMLSMVASGFRGTVKKRIQEDLDFLRQNLRA